MLLLQLDRSESAILLKQQSRICNGAGDFRSCVVGKAIEAVAGHIFGSIGISVPARLPSALPLIWGRNASPTLLFQGAEARLYLVIYRKENVQADP